MADENEPCDTRADTVIRRIRDKVTTDIMRDGESDAELLNILNSRIVTPDLNATSVEKAVDDIRDLAKRRAES